MSMFATACAICQASSLLGCPTAEVAVGLGGAPVLLVACWLLAAGVAAAMGAPWGETVETVLVAAGDFDGTFGEARAVLSGASGS
jgi:hypothetical protein